MAPMYYIVSGKGLSRGRPCTNHEASEIQNNVEHAIDLVVPCLCLSEILTIPVQPSSGNETCKEIVSSEHTARADGKQANCEGQQQV